MAPKTPQIISIKKCPWSSLSLDLNRIPFSKFFQGKQFIHWEIPGTNHKIAMFETGFGDGYYMSLWGLNEKDEICELVIPFINPEIID